MGIRSSSLLVNFGLRVSPAMSVSEKSIMRWTVVSLVQQTGWTAADHVRCEKLATACSVMASVVNYLKYKYFKYVFEIHTEY